MSREYTSDSINDLATALAKAQGKIANASKGVENTYFKSKYADLAACVTVSREPLSENGLSIVQFPDYDGQDQWLVTQLMHASGQWLRSYYPVRPIKNDPQALGSAVTYARRYAYCAMVGIAAEGEDDDGNAASGKEVKKQESSASVNRSNHILIEGLRGAESPIAYWAEHAKDIEQYIDCDEPESAERTLLLAAKERIKKILEKSEDPAVDWSEQNKLIARINKICAAKEFNDLKATSDKRRNELAQMEAVKAGMPQGFNAITPQH